MVKTFNQTVQTWKDDNPVTYESGAYNAAWNKLELAAPNFSAIEQLGNIVDALRKVLSAVIDLLEALAHLVVGVVDAVVEVIQGVIDQIRKILDSLLDDAGLYLLFVPPGKNFNTTFAGIGDITPPILPPNENRYAGGNSGFYRQVQASLHDRGDRNRPQFMSSTDYVAGMVMVLGTGIDPFGFLDDLWRLKGLFGNLFQASPTVKVPKPKNLTAYALTRPGKEKKLSVVLKWDTLDIPIETLPDLGGIILTPARQAIIAVRNNILSSTSSTVIELLGTRDVNADTRNGDDIWVLDESKFQLTDNTYIARDLPIEEGDIYHFFVAWKLKEWKGDTLEYSELSNVARVHPFPLFADSTPPDWVRSPSVAEVVPPLAYFLKYIVGFIDSLASRIRTPADRITAYAEFLRKELRRYEALVDAILRQVKTITELLQAPKVTGGVYLRAYSGQGGNNFFLNDLAQSLAASYPNSPPFHRGDEYVAGVVLLMGGPEAKVNASWSVLKSIFSAGQGQMEGLADTLGAAVGELEAAVFEFEDEPEERTYFSDTLETLETLTLCDPPDAEEWMFGPDLQRIQQ